MQDTFDTLYSDSREGKNHKNLYNIIISEQNIMLAYRKIKSNHGSRTAGTDKNTIDIFRNMSKDEFVNFIKDKLNRYKPEPVRRVLIPKHNGDKRPLGIPSIADRIIQQMFKQVLEPICEAKFFNHSYGFRPERSTHHAMARCQYLINKGFHYVVDIDIKGFFDNVNHRRLMKQIWNIGIQDRRINAIISKMLKAPIDKEGIPTKGTPQGGILSPLLSNIVLNDLDYWIADQWELFETRHPYVQNTKKYVSLRRASKMKEGFIVRYADDFKIFAKDHQTAYKWFHAVRLYLRDRLKLEISPEKSKVINLRKNYSEFLGFKLKANKKRKSYVAHTFVKDEKKKDIKEKYRKLVKDINKNPTPANVFKLNEYILGLHQYFKIATHVTNEFQRMSTDLFRTMHHNFSKIGGKFEKSRGQPETYKKFYKNNYKTWKIQGIYIFPIADIRHRKSINFSQNVTPYTENGRESIYKNLDEAISINIQGLMRSHLPNRSTEYMDNRISRYSMRNGKCEVTKRFLMSWEVHCHHYLPTHLGGEDNFQNLRIVHSDIHRLIHSTNEETIEVIMEELQLNREQLNKLNQFRKKCNLEEISI